MKKVIFMAAILAGLSFSSSSCKKCGHCEYKNNGGPGSTFCSTSPTNKLTYDAEKSSCEGGGDKWVTE